MRLLLILAVLLGQTASGLEIERVEPPFWWQGFHDTELQLLVYGKDIAGATVSVSHPGVELRRVVRATSPNYLFVYLDVGGAQPGAFDIAFDHNDERLTHRYELRQKNPDVAHTQGYSTADAIYLITPDRFANGDTGNDNVAALGDPVNRAGWQDRHGGDIAGIAQHLDYIDNMGFTAIWLNPVLENAMPRTSYHGYATTDFYQVDARFGSNEEYRDLVQQARRRGIGTIMDMIANHCGLEHWWLDDLPSPDWINYRGQFVGTTHERTAVHDPYGSRADLAAFADGWFVPAMPDLNQRNPLMADYLIQNTLWWIEYLGLAGIRQDTYPYPDHDFMSAWTKRVMDEYPHFNIVGEQWSLDPIVVSYWQRGKQNKDGYVSYLPSLMDFPLHDALRRALTEDGEWENGMLWVYRMLANDVVYADPTNLVVFGDNHDMSRVYTQLGEDFDLWKMAMVFLLTTRGTPQIYYGTEILMVNRESGDHGLIRSDFPGGWPGDKTSAFSGKGLSKRQREAQSFLKTLLNWRKQKTVVHDGKLMHFSPATGVYVYFRYDDNDKVMVVLNKNRERTRLGLGRFAEMLGGHASGVDVVSGAVVSLDDSLDLPGPSATIIDLR